jgi:NAD+ synthetase
MAAENYDQADPKGHSFKIRMGNVKARMRMLYLYDLAQSSSGMVLSTDNYTELLLGFWTLHGDVGDYGMIQNLWKSEVYDMARYLASEMDDTNAAEALLSCVDAVATDGLGITNSDLDQLKAASYAVVDEILIDYLRYPHKYDGDNLHPVIERHLQSDYKRENPYNIPREYITDEPAI